MSNVTVTVSPPSSGQVSIEIEADTAEAVQDAIDRYCCAYHPMGYGTVFTAPVLVSDRWRSIGHRRTGCD